MENINNILNIIFSNQYYTAAFWLFALLVVSYLAVPIFFWILTLFIGKTKTDFDDKLFAIIKPPVFWTVILAGILMYISTSKILPSFAVLIVESIMIVLWIGPLGKAVQLLLEYGAKYNKGFVKQPIIPLLKNVSLVVIWSLAIYFLFGIWGISLTAWLASAGIVGIAVGFAAKDTLSNLISGIFILADAPYKVNDIIRLDSGETGVVIHVGLRSTRIRTYDGAEVTIPNAQMGNSKIVNETGTRIEKKFRLKVPIGVSYETDIEEAEKILLDIAKEFDDVCDEPEPSVVFLNFGASSLDLELRVWLPDPSKRGIKNDINRRILEEFRKAKIEIPYPKNDVYIKKEQ